MILTSEGRKEKNIALMTVLDRIHLDRIQTHLSRLGHTELQNLSNQTTGQRTILCVQMDQEGPLRHIHLPIRFMLALSLRVLMMASQHMHPRPLSRLLCILKTRS